MLAPTARAQGSFTGKPRYTLEARRGGAVFGIVRLELFPTIAPRAVAYWDSLVAVQFYDSTAFHRVIPGFVIQGGDPNSRRGPRSTWGFGQPNQPNVPAEFSALSHERGILSAARAANINSANSQFFICVAAARSLNGQYTAYGQVRSGMAVVDQIVSAPRDGNDNPFQKIEMFIRRVGSNDTVARVPRLLAPADRAGGQPAQPVLRWRVEADALLHDVQVSTDSTFATGALLLDITLGQLDSSRTLAALPPATTVFWRVRANNGGSVSAWSGAWRFRTGAAAPALLAPANNAGTGLTVTPLLQWAPVAGATSYQVQVSRSPQFRANQIIRDESNLLTPEWQVPSPGLTLGQRVYWRARAVLGTEGGFFADAWNFTPTLPTAVAGDLMAAVALAPAVPNPAGADGTVLAFTLAAPGPAGLTVLDAVGRVVACPLAAPWLAAGGHRATLAPGALAPGVYVVRLEAAGVRRVARLVVE